MSLHEKLLRHGQRSQTLALRVKGVFRSLLTRPSALEIDEEFVCKGRKYSPRVWWLLLRESIYQANTHDLGTKSSALTYSFILALGPLLATAFFFFQQFGGLEKLIDETLVPLISAYFSEAAGKQLQSYLIDFVRNFKPALLGSVAIATFLVTVVGLLYGIEKSFNDIFASPTKRPFWKQVLNYWTLLTLTPFVVTFSTSKTATLWDKVPSIQALASKLSVVGHLFSFGVLTLGFAALFLILPNRGVPLKGLLWGGALTAFLFKILQYINVFLTKNIFANTTATALYGTAPIIAVAFFFWIRLVWLVLLIGACLAVAIANFEEFANADSCELAPVDGVLFCAGVFAAVCNDYRASGNGISVQRIAAQLDISAASVEKWIFWLEKRRVVFSSASNMGACFFPTHYGLSLESEPKTFLEKILFFRFAEESLETAAKRNADSSSFSFLEKIEKILQSVVKS
jgi:YihY family inner membrane protein